MEVEVAEEDHVIDHEAEKGSQLVLGWQHELLGLILNDAHNLRLNLATLLQDKVGPGKLFFDSIVKVAVLGSIRVCVEDMEGEPAGSVKFNDLERHATGGHSHATSHQLQLLAWLLLKQV